MRAKDYNEKKKRLKILREKAAERNPDEFHFAMMSSKTDKSGRKIADRGNKSLSTVSVKLLKTQDAGYLRTMAQQTRRAREKLEEVFTLGQGDCVHQNVTLSKERCGVKGPQHLRFVGSREEQKAFDLGRVEEGKTKVVLPGKPSLPLFDGSLLDSAGDDDSDVPAQHRPSLKRSTEAQAQLLKANRAIRKRRNKQHEARKAKLENLRKREKDLMAAEYELELQRAKMSSSVGGVTKAGLKWKARERKR